MQTKQKTIAISLKLAQEMREKYEAKQEFKHVTFNKFSSIMIEKGLESLK